MLDIADSFSHRLQRSVDDSLNDVRVSVSGKRKSWKVVVNSLTSLLWGLLLFLLTLFLQVVQSLSLSFLQPPSVGPPHNTQLTTSDTGLLLYSGGGSMEMKLKKIFRKSLLMLRQLKKILKMKQSCCYEKRTSVLNKAPFVEFLIIYANSCLNVSVLSKGSLHSIQKEI